MKELTPILSEYAKLNSISIVIQKKNIIIGKSNLDITNDILNIVNQKLDKIKLN
jgi:outer membrane protein